MEVLAGKASCIFTNDFNGMTAKFLYVYNNYIATLCNYNAALVRYSTSSHGDGMGITVVYGVDVMVGVLRMFFKWGISFL